MILPATRKHEELAFLGPDPDREDRVAAQDDGAGGRPDARGCTA